LNASQRLVCNILVLNIKMYRIGLCIDCKSEFIMTRVKSCEFK